MKFEKLVGQAFLLTLFLGVTGAANATTLGLTSTPTGAIWSRGDANSGYAVFDTFPGTSYSNDAADSSAGISGLTLSQTTTFTQLGQGASTYSNISTFAPGNDILFPGANALTFVLAGTTSFTIGDLYLSVKRPNSLIGLASSFTPQLSLDGGTTWVSATSTALATGSGDTNGNSGNYSVDSWNWSGLQAANSSSILINFNSNGTSQIPVDGISVDVAAVPEPAAYALVLLGIGALFVLHRTRKEKISLN